MKTVHRYWKYTTLALAFIVAVLSYERYSTKKRLDVVYTYSHIVEVVDADTGERLSPATSAPSSSSTELFNQIYSISSLGDDLIKIDGVAYEDRTWRFNQEGYKEARLEITKDHKPHKIHIKLQPKDKPNKSAHTNPLPAE